MFLSFWELYSWPTLFLRSQQIIVYIAYMRGILWFCNYNVYIYIYTYILHHAYIRLLHSFSLQLQNGQAFSYWTARSQGAFPAEKRCSPSSWDPQKANFRNLRPTDQRWKLQPVQIKKKFKHVFNYWVLNVYIHLVVWVKIRCTT